MAVFCIETNSAYTEMVNQLLRNTAIIGYKNGYGLFKDCISKRLQLDWST